MGVRRFNDLVAWQLAHELKRRVYEILERPKVARDLKFVSQIRDSASSSPGNLAEGFGRYSHREFPRYTEIARGSLLETQNDLLDGRDRGYIAEPEPSDLLHLARRALIAVTRLQNYLRRSPSEPPGWR